MPPLLPDVVLPRKRIPEPSALSMWLDIVIALRSLAPVPPIEVN